MTHTHRSSIDVSVGNNSLTLIYKEFDRAARVTRMRVDDDDDKVCPQRTVSGTNPDKRGHMMMIKYPERTSC